MEGVKNTFGLPVIEAVRAEVLKLDPEYNFLIPRVKMSGLKSSLTFQYKQRGAMGSFVKNLNKQINRVDEIATDIKKMPRVGVRALDLPYRSLVKTFKGSGHENVLQAYMAEISSEIAKLSRGASASISELSADAQKQWDKIHDPSLSYNQLKIILDETSHMADMRLASTDDEIEYTLGQLENIRTSDTRSTGKAKSKFKILKVE